MLREMGLRIREIQATPNPNALKFVLEGEISPEPLSFLGPDQGKEHPVASQLFQIEGVTSVLLLGDFVTVNKTADANWPPIRDQVRKVLASLD